MRSLLAACLGSILVLAACTSDRRQDATQPSPAATATTAPNADADADLPRAVAQTRSGILSAARSGDYDMLRPLLDRDVFLSDFGFGGDAPDPISRWQELGRDPLQMMAILLGMEHVVEETNEGVLYRWPSYDEETTSLDNLRPADRRAFRSILSARDARRLVPDPEYGYVGPRLGILEDGTWWFFILDGGP